MDTYSITDIIWDADRDAIGYRHALIDSKPYIDTAIADARAHYDALSHAYEQYLRDSRRWDAADLGSSDASGQNQGSVDTDN